MYIQCSHSKPKVSSVSELMVNFLIFGASIQIHRKCRDCWEFFMRIALNSISWFIHLNSLISEMLTKHFRKVENNFLVSYLCLSFVNRFFFPFILSHRLTHHSDHGRFFGAMMAFVNSLCSFVCCLPLDNRNRYTPPLQHERRNILCKVWEWILPRAANEYDEKWSSTYIHTMPTMPK